MDSMINISNRVDDFADGLDDIAGSIVIVANCSTNPEIALKALEVMLAAIEKGTIKSPVSVSNVTMNHNSNPPVEKIEAKTSDIYNQYYNSLDRLLGYIKTPGPSNNTI